MPDSRMMLSRRDAIGVLAGATAAAAVPRIARAQAWPDKPGKIVVAFPPGTSTDNFARALAGQFQVQFGQPFVVENRPGAGGWTGTLAVAESKPDGATMTVNANGISILGLVRKNSFDATKDLTPIAILARSPVAFLIPNSLPVKTIKELVDYVKGRNNDFFYGSAGIGSINHLYGELFNQRAGIQMKHVPYRGFGEALPDLAAGRISLIFSSYATGAGMIKSGQLRLLAYGSDARPEGTPDAPSVRASGIDYETSFWWALFGPGGMPVDMRNKINAATNTAMKDPGFAKLFLNSGVVPAPMDADAFTAEVKKHYAELKAVVDSAKIVFE